MSDYLGEWGGRSVYQPTRKLPTRWLMAPSVRICAAKCTRWFLIVVEDHRDGLCNECFVEQFEGEEDMVL